MDVTVVVGLAEWLAQRISEWQDVAIGGIGLGVIVIVGATFVGTRMVVKTLTMLLVGAAVLWAVSNTDWLVDRVGDETDGAPAQVQPAGLPPAPSLTPPRGGR